MTPFQRGATYERISKADAGDEDGVIRQGEDTEELAGRRGIPIDGRRFRDNDKSATHGKRRPDYDRLIAAVERGEVDVIIVYMLGRLWRNRKERADGIEILRKHGVSVLCVKGPELDLTTAAGRLLAGLLGEVDTFEVEQMSEREQREMRQRVERGEIPTGPRCFGYTPDGDEVIDTEAAEVRKMYQALAAGGTLSGIAADLNKREILNRNGKAWTHNAVRYLLMNERYAGLREYNGTTYTGKWPAIVNEDVWRQAVAILTDPSRKTSPGPARKWLLSGLARCGVCNNGTTVTSAQRSAKGSYEGARIYKCRGPVKHLGRTAEPIDRLIAGVEPGQPLGLVPQLLVREDAARLLLDDERPDMDELNAKATVLRARLKNMADAFADDDEADALEFKRAVRRIKDRLKEIEQQMTSPARAAVLGELVRSDDIVAAWAATPLDRKRAVVDMLMTVTIHSCGPGRHRFDPESIEIVPKLR
ncbi:recombinase family protein [Streptomyces sp. NPDC088770]|uniref:recombinase family protein n=1 Tax=unclassified Streptomyces TaxID=2593676 RepID=UPI002DDAB957|nr:recombinase family protein [Streptomyces sp. NBC_01788]WSB29651.1 recombinase family protein [Streptomyces sp. NBC_01788]